MEETVYTQNGYLDRNDYLESLALDYGIDLDLVMAIADTLGEGEDFDGLISALEFYDEYDELNF